MKKLALKVEELQVESFESSTPRRGGVVSRASETGVDCPTHTCSEDPLCTLPCGWESNATDWDWCCG